MATEISTTKFQASHGKLPKGAGCWAFIVMAGRTELATFFVPGMMTFSDAKVWAKAKFNADFAGASHLEVVP